MKVEAGAGIGSGGPVGFDLVEQFLASIYGDAGAVWTAGFGDFGAPSWHGGFGLGHIRALDPARNNFYFCVGLLRPGAQRRALNEVTRQYLVVADDVGTKVDRARWEALITSGGCPPPTFQIETSCVAGVANETWGWVLDAPIAEDNTSEWEALARLRAHWGAENLTDPGVNDPAHYIRLPLGWNNKPRYTAGGAAPSRVRLLAWVPGRVTSLDKLGEATIGADWRTRALPVKAMPSGMLTGSGMLGALTRTADLNQAEPIMRLAQVLGLNPVQTRAGVVEASCPNWEAHTQDGREHSGFAFLGDGRMHCHHMSCQHLATPDFRRIMVEKFDEMAAGLRAVGLPTPDNALDGEHFLALAQLADAGLLDAGAVLDAENEAAELASRMSEAATRRAAVVADLEDQLFERFVFVTDVDAFFDCERRVMLSARAFDRSDEARVLAPYGASGQKSAVAKFFNDDRRVVVENVTYRPGDKRAVVELLDATGAVVTDAAGRPRRLANRWSPSRVGVSYDPPRYWLQAVEHVLPDVAYREWWLNWVAHHIQNPSLRTATIPVIHGAQGTGKDMILAPLRAIIGEDNCASISSRELVGSFNGWATRRFLVLNEFRLEANSSDYARLKALTGTARAVKITINEKFVKPYDVEFVGFFVATTNDETALGGLDHDDRRFAVYCSPAQRHPTDGWYRDMFRSLGTADELARIHGFLLSRDLTGFDPHAEAPDVNGSKATMTGLGQNAVVQQVIEDMTNGKFAGRRVVSFGEVHRYFQNHPVQRVRGGVNWSVVRRGLLLAGARVLHQGRLVSVGGRPGRLWASPSLSVQEVEAIDAGGPGAISNEFVKDWLASPDGQAVPGATAKDCPV